MLVTDRRRVRHHDLLHAVVEAVGGGVGMVQVREKDLPDRDLERLLAELRAVLPPSTILVVNDRPVLARALGIGVHLPAARAGTRVSGVPLVGRSVHDAAELGAALASAPDYVIGGTVFPTRSKPGVAGAGVELVRGLAQLAGQVPLYAIGGITVSHVPEVMHAGAHGIAVCGAILEQPDPRRAAEGFSLALSVSKDRAELH